jgi:fused signal recognition particle receptor
MALGFIKKVFSFGNKEVLERPAEDEPLAPLNFEALKQFVTEAPHPPLEGEGRREATGWGEAEEPEVTPTGASGATSPVEGEVSAPPPAPDPTPEIVPEKPQEPGPSPDAANPPLEGEDRRKATGRSESELDRREATGWREPKEPEVAPTRVFDATSPLKGEVSAPPPAPRPASEFVHKPDVPATSVTAVPSTPTGGKVTVAKKVEQKAEPQPVAPAPQPRKTWFQRLREGLSRSSRELSGSIAGIFTKRKLDDETLEELEDVLIRADLGMETALRVTDTLAASRYGKDVSDTEVRAIMAQEIEKVLTPVARALELDLSHKPHVILVVGVNGTGKTTTIGKLAAKLQQGGLSVMLAAGDTFRAAAIEQLKIWGERTGSPVVSSKLGADAAGLAWDAFEAAKEAGSDVLIIDTAGRLQNKTELMAELEKIVRVLGKHDPDAPHTVLQTVDATTGQNALNQVEIFRNVAGVNGLVMTKLDGTARGGILVAIAAKHKLPVYFIGVGEQIDDLEPFSAGDFAKAIAGVG